MSKRRAPRKEASTFAGGSRTLIEQVYVQLRDDIVEGSLLPGAKLRIEHLRQRYGVGAGTLREAITRLVSDALGGAQLAFSRTADLRPAIAMDAAHLACFGASRRAVP